MSESAYGILLSIVKVFDYCTAGGVHGGLMAGLGAGIGVGY
jgi:hypothetical protein